MTVPQPNCHHCALTTDRQALIEMLSAEPSPTDAVRRSAQLLACTRLGIVVDIPVKTVSALVAHLVTERAGEDDRGVDALQEYHARVREYLLCLQRGADTEAAERLSELERGLGELRQAVLAKIERGAAGDVKPVDTENVDTENALEEPSSTTDEPEYEQRDHGEPKKEGKKQRVKRGKKRAD